MRLAAVLALLVALSACERGGTTTIGIGSDGDIGISTDEAAIAISGED